MYKFAVAIVAAFAVFFGQASAATLLADNPGEPLPLFVTATNAHLLPVDACNGSNHYGEGHDCAFKSADGTAEGGKYKCTHPGRCIANGSPSVCHKDGSGVLTCVPN